MRRRSGDENVCTRIEDPDADQHRQQSSRRPQARRRDRRGHDRDGDGRGARSDHGPRRALVRSRIQADDKEPEAERGHYGKTGSGRDAPLPSARRLPGEHHDAGQHEGDPEPLQGGRRVALRCVDRERDDRRGRRDRCDDSHRADGESAVERAEADEAGDPCCGCGQELTDPWKGVPGDEHPDEEPGKPDRLRDDEHRDDGQTTRREPAEEVSDTPREGASEREEGRQAGSVVADGARRGLCVELVRVVQNGGLGRSRGGSVVMARDGMEEFGEDSRIEVTGAFLEHPQAEVHVAEQPALLGPPERRAAAELADAPDVVQERGGEQEIVAEPWMQLRGLAAERRDAHGVLEQSARVAVVPVGTGCRKRAECLPDLGVANERAHHLREAGVRDLGCEELEEAVELVGVATERGRQLGRIGVLRGLDGPDLHLELAAEPFHATEDVHGVTFTEALVEQVDVVPDSRLDASARVRELESEVRGSGASAPTLLLRDREHALDGPVLREVGDRGHAPSLFLETVGTLAAMADVQPFRAVRYSGAAGALADLVAPPYDAVDDDERARLYTRSPYNVVHVTLPETAEDAGRLYREWLASGILASDAEPATWVSVETYVGPDGVARERHGTIVSLAAEPYETGTVLPHERTHERSGRSGCASFVRRTSSRSRS